MQAREKGGMAPRRQRAIIDSILKLRKMVDSMLSPRRAAFSPSRANQRSAKEAVTRSHLRSLRVHCGGVK